MADNDAHDGAPEAWDCDPNYKLPERQMTVPAYLALVRKGARKADELVMPLVGWEWREQNPHHWPRGWYRDTAPYSIPKVLPYATAGPDHPERWKLWGEMVDALAAIRDMWQAVRWVARVIKKYGADTPNAAAAVALLLAHGKLKEDE